MSVFRLCRITHQVEPEVNKAAKLAIKTITQVAQGLVVNLATHPPVLHRYQPLPHVGVSNHVVFKDYESLEEKALVLE